MGLTITELQSGKAAGGRQVIAAIDWETYVTGGLPFDPAILFGIKQIRSVQIESRDGYVFGYDYTNRKIKAFKPTSVPSLTFTGTAPAAHGHTFTGTALTAQTVTVKDDDTAASLGTAVSARMIDGYFAKLESPNAGGADANFATSGGRLAVFVPRRHVTLIAVEDLGAGVDITARSVWAAPASGATLLKAGIVGSGSPAGMDAGNACVVLLRDAAGNAIVTKTYDDSPVFPADGVYDSLGALDATHSILTANEVVQLSVTNGAAADPPPFIVVIEWEEQEALFPVYFDEDATAGSRFLINNTVTGLDLFVRDTGGRVIKLTHVADPAAAGVRCYFDDDGATAAEKLVFVSPTNTNGTENFSVTVDGAGRVAAGANATTVAATPAGAISGEADVVAAEVADSTDLSALTSHVVIIAGE